MVRDNLDSIFRLPQGRPNSAFFFTAFHNMYTRDFRITKIKNNYIPDITYDLLPMFFFCHADNAPESYKTKLSKVDSSIPLIRCYCNLPDCLDATHGMPVCYTRQGCFSRIKTNVTELSGPSKLLDPYPAPTTPRPIPKVFDERLLMSKTDHEVNGAHGCLDLLPT